MNKKQWDKNQQYIAMAQKQAAKDAKAIMLGVEPKVKLPVGPQNYADMLASYYHVFVDGVEIKGEMKIAWDLPISYTSWSMSSSPVVSQLSEIVPALATHIIQCPKCAYLGVARSDTLAKLIPHLNDHHKWTREAIADWLDTLDVDLTVKPKTKETHDDDDEGKEESAWQGATYVTIGTADYAVTSAHITKSYGLATGVA